MCPREQDPPTWQAGSSLGLSELSSTLSRQGGAVAPPGLASLNQGPGCLCLAGAGSFKVSWPRHQLSPHRTLVTSPTHLLHRHCICLRESLLKCLAQPNQLQGVSNFSPHFRTWPPAPFRWGGGGSHSVFPKTQFLVHNVYFLRRGN